MANHLRRSKRRNHDQTLPSRDFFSSLLTEEKGHEQTHAPQQTNPCLPTTRQPHGGDTRQAAGAAAAKGLKLLVRFSRMPASAMVIAVIGAEGLSQPSRPV
jgi:hypothetical protein